jgi:hypothetical protein
MPRCILSSLAGAAACALVLTLARADVGVADSTPVGSLPSGPRVSMTTKPGLLVAVALPRKPESSGLAWRVARSYDTSVVRQVSEADVGRSVVVVYRVVGRGRTLLVFALTRGDASPEAIAAVTYAIRSV